MSNIEQISEHVDDVSISCDEDLTVDCKEINATVKWNFQIETEVRFTRFIFITTIESFVLFLCEIT